MDGWTSVLFCVGSDIPYKMTNTKDGESIGMKTSNQNNITKVDAMGFMSRIRSQRDKEYVINALVRCTIFGEEYPAEKRFGELEMSYFCRGFNITEFNASKQKNRIKGRYRKYAQRPDVVNFFIEILSNNWPGFRTESPRMDELLENFAKGIQNVGNNSWNSGSKANQTIQGKTNQTVQRKVKQPAPSKANGSKSFVHESRDVGAGGWKSIRDKAFWVIGMVILFSWLAKSCGKGSVSGNSSDKGESVFSGIIHFFTSLIDIIIFIFLRLVAAVLFLVPIIILITSRTWKKPSRLIAGIIIYMISFSCFTLEGGYPILFGFVFWICGNLVWGKEL